MSDSRRPILIFVPGAGHRATVWQSVTDKLESDGYTCLCPTLPSTTNDPSLGVLDDIAAITAVIESLNQSPAMLIAHSYGALPAATSIRPGSPVIGFVAIATGWATTGGTLFSTNGGVPPPPWVLENSGLAKFTGDSRNLLYHDLPEDKALYWTSQLKRQGIGSGTATGYMYAGWQHVPCWYFLTTEDRLFPAALQRQLVEQAQLQRAQDGRGGITVKEVASSRKTPP
jgi:pimeloyl-ACP methyl ester carboxylesterase